MIDLKIKKFISSFTKQSIFAGAVSVVVGFVTHFFILVNPPLNLDDLYELWRKSDYNFNKDRWLQSIFEPMVSSWESGWVAGLLLFIILGVCAILIVDWFNIESYAMSFLIGAMMSATPVVACFLMWPQGSYLFVVGVPFAILASRWYQKGIKGWIISTIFIMIAIAGYQSNICIAIACLYIHFYSRLIEKEFDIKKWWIDFAKATIMLIAGLVIYVVIRLIIGKIQGFNNFTFGVTNEQLTLSGYEAQAEMGRLFLGNIMPSIVMSVKWFIKYHFNIFFDGPNISFASHVNVISSIVIALSIIFLIAINTIRAKGITRKIMIIFVTLALPICFNSIVILLNGKCLESLQMMYSMVLITPFVICLLEKEKNLKEKTRNRLSYLVFLMLIVHLYGNIQIINDAYQRTRSISETVHSEMTRIIDRVEQTEEWQNGCRLLYFDYEDGEGCLNNSNYQAMKVRDDFIDTGWMPMIGTVVTAWWKNPSTSNYVRFYCGLVFETPTEEQIEKIKSTEEYETLEEFPSENAIKVIDGVIVVRID